jgi:hypothetical protein
MLGVTLDELLHDPELGRSLSRVELADAYRLAARLEADLRALLLAAPPEAPNAEELLSLAQAATPRGQEIPPSRGRPAW